MTKIPKKVIDLFIVVFLLIIGALGCAAPTSVTQSEYAKMSKSLESGEPQPLASKYILRPPKVDINSSSATIFIYRIPLFLADGVPKLIYLDNIPTFSIMPRDYTLFKVSSGVHVIYLMDFQGFYIDINPILIDCAPGENYFICVTNSGIFKTTAEEGKAFISTYKHIPLE